MIFYLTFNDAPSGIYSSQVIDVVKFIRKNTPTKIKLLAFVSLRVFFSDRKKIKASLSDAIVLPMVPGIKNWRLNAVLLKLLCLFMRPKAIIGRSVLATQLAFKSGVKKIIYDGRGAIAAEWKEYSVITDPKMLSEIQELEREAVINSSFRIAVSHQLVKFWQQEFGYNETNHVVIPCTLNQVFEQITITDNSIEKARQNFGFKKDDVVLAYSGSLAGWQSFELLDAFIVPHLKENLQIKLLFLAGADKNIVKLEREFPGRVFHKHVSAVDVPACLLAADYGLLIREESVTNKVASPVKFAEYLACGLKVIISPGLGDYSDLIEKDKRLGSIYGSLTRFSPVTMEEKLAIRQTGISRYTKEQFTTEYTELIRNT